VIYGPELNTICQGGGAAATSGGTTAGGEARNGGEEQRQVFRRHTVTLGLRVPF
jgi:hypothetical protein